MIANPGAGKGKTMATCTECGRRVPFGGGKTAKNAHTMFEYVRELEARPDADQRSREFVTRGRRLAESVHAYGHKDSMVNPDWAAAGSWTREAQAIYARLLLSEEHPDERVQEGRRPEVERQEERAKDMMTQCKFCGGEIRRRDANAVDTAGSIGSALAPLLVAIEVLAADVGRDDPELQEVERFARNGAGMAKALHDAAHGDSIMASQFAPNVAGWIDTALEGAKEAKDEYPTRLEAAAAAMGGWEAVGGRARWMVDNVTWSSSGQVILPNPPWTTAT